MSAFGGKADIEAGPYLLSAKRRQLAPGFKKRGLKLAAVASVAAGQSWGLNSTHLHGTHVPVEEPSTASKADMCGALIDVRFGPIADMEPTSFAANRSHRRRLRAMNLARRVGAHEQSCD